MHFIKRRILPEAEFVFVRGLLLLTYWRESIRSDVCEGKLFGFITNPSNCLGKQTIWQEVTAQISW